MSYGNLSYSLYKLLKVRFFGDKFPLVVRWDITAHCPLKCKYCGIWRLRFKDLDTATVFRIINEMAEAGVKKISFSGGEPLLRDDICEIIKYTKDKGISCEMNSTGFLFPEKADKLRSLDLLKLSLDGPREINDTVRGRKGAYQWTIEAARYAKKSGVRFVFCSTLTGYNIDYVGYMLELAEDFKSRVRFQPLKDIRYLKYNNFVDNADSQQLFPSKAQFKRALDTLIEYSGRKNSLMCNSYQSLIHIYNWPQYSKLKCWAGRIFCMINPAGDVSPCDRLFYGTKLPNCAEASFKESLKNLPPLPFCAGCGFLGALTLNCLMNFKLDISLLKKVIV